MSDEVKVVISIKGTGASVGIQKPDCDPVFARLEGDLPTVLGAIPVLFDQANQRWSANPKYPKTETKLEPPAQPQPKQSTAPRSTSQRNQPTNQQPMF